MAEASGNVLGERIFAARFHPGMTELAKARLDIRAENIG